MQRPTHYTHRLWRQDKRAAVTLLVAMAVPMLAAVCALAVEVTIWTSHKLELQRMADTASLAGIIKYATTDSAQTGATEALRIVELSGLTGGGTPVWNAGTATLSNTQVTARLEAGLKNAANNKAIYVSVTKTMPRGISALISPGGSIAITASAKAELDGAQPCLVTLHNAAMQFANYASVNASTCAIWSNGTIVAVNNVNVTVSDIYAAGNISTANSAVLNARLNPNAGAVEDPYLQNPEIVTLRAGLSSGTGTPIATTSTLTLSPGSYSSLSLTLGANVTLNPGTYYVNGNISLRNSSILTGTGVTIVTSGSIVLEQSSTIDLAAANGDVGGAIGGIVIVSTGSSIRLENSGTRNLTGVIYAPNASLSIDNNATLTTTSCLQYIVGNATIGNNANMDASTCVSMGAQSFGRKRLLVQ